MYKLPLACLALLLAGCNPNIQLDKDKWVCTKIEPRDKTSFIFAGKAAIASKDKQNICTRWEMPE